MARRDSAEADPEMRFHVTKELVNWYSASATTTCPDPLDGVKRWPTWPIKEVYAPISACRRASEFLIEKLAGLEPPISATEDEITLSIRPYDQGIILVQALYRLDETHPVVQQVQQTIAERFKS